MNDKVRNLDIESLLFWDIETVSRNKELEIDSKEYELFQQKTRNRDTDKFLTDTKLQSEYKRIAALNPAFNKIVCISIGYVKGNTFYYRAITGEQKYIIETFYGILNKGTHIPTGYNTIAFDAPVTRIKGEESMCDVHINSKYNDSQKKPWNLTEAHLDLMEVVKGTYYYNLSLDEVCYLLGIESPKSDIKGSDVTKEYYKNGVDKIAKYCNEDVKALARIVCRLQGDKNRIQEYVDKTTEEIKVERIPIIEKVRNTGKLLKRDADKLIQQYKDSPEKTRLETIANVEAMLLVNNNKTQLKKIKQFEYLKAELT